MPAASMLAWEYQEDQPCWDLSTKPFTLPNVPTNDPFKSIQGPSNTMPSQTYEPYSKF